MRLSTNARIEAEADVEYGPYRLRVAEWAGVLPADVTESHVARYEIACDEEGRTP